MVRFPWFMLGNNPTNFPLFYQSLGTSLYETSTIEELIRGINQFGLPEKLIKLFQMTVRNTWSCGKIGKVLHCFWKQFDGKKEKDVCSAFEEFISPTEWE